MKKFRGYIFSRPFLGERVPQSVQNLVIRDFCKKNNFTFLLSATEYAMDYSDLMLFKIIEELENLDGIIAYSLFQLPIDKDKRSMIFDRIIDKRKSLYFALEGLEMNKRDHIDQINDLWDIKRTLPNCLKGFN